MGMAPSLGSSASLAERYLSTRRLTQRLVAPLSAEDQMVQSMPEASPAKWHQAHTTWFFETFVLEPHAPEYRPFHSSFRFLFNSYYKQLANQAAIPHPSRSLRGTFSRPSLEEVKQYREHVDAAMLRLLEANVSAEALALAELGLHHEQQHQELTLTDIKHAFWVHPLRPAYAAAEFPRAGGELPLEWVRYRGGVVSIGHEDECFAFDNETPQHEVLLAPYRMGSRLVTNGDYLDFMRDGGYSRPDLWLSDGWDRVCAEQWRAPLYWETRDGDWLEFTLSGMAPVESARPVCHVSYYEADAFARWAGARLPTEFEWEAAAQKKTVAGNFLESELLHPAPAPATGGQHPTTAQLFGDCWEWTASAYAPYPGYRAAAGALGEYNGKFMCNQMVLRGGSCVTPEPHIRASYRNFFPPHARWQFMGIRLANDGD